MRYEVSVAVQARGPIAAVAATTTWERYPGQWPGMLDEVYACLKRAGVKQSPDPAAGGVRALAWLG